MEQLQAERSLTDILIEASAAMPQVLDTMKAANAKEQREAFLADTIDNPHHVYDELSAVDYEAVDQHLVALGQELASHSEISKDVLRSAYAAYIEEGRMKNALLQAAALLNSDASADVKEEAAQAYATLNESLYGSVDMDTYRTIIADKVRAIQIDPEDVDAAVLLEELRGMFPEEFLQSDEVPYRPTDECFQTMHETAELLFGGLARHIPDRDGLYRFEEIRYLLDEIIREEFGESAADWRVVPTEQGGLSVHAEKKEVHISRDTSKDAAGLRGSVVHELGVHMLRAIRGGETDLLPMELGFADYGAAEEGLAMVMQQAINGKYELAGAGHYITAGFIAAGHDFRETFEMKWRLAVLQAYNPQEGINAESVEKARRAAYRDVRRIMRGTDTLPMHKDLSYYNGTKAMWDYFERYAGNEFRLNLALLGKLDPSQQDNIRAALESRSKRNKYDDLEDAA
jgi:hypothetical protein